MKPYFFLIPFCFLMDSTGALAMDTTQFDTTKSKNPSPLYYPAIGFSSRVAAALFIDRPQKHLNCPLLFDTSLDLPNGTSMALCNDVQLACLRYGLLVEKMKTATGKLLEELKKTMVLEVEEVKVRLRCCQLILEATTLSNISLEEAAGYTSDLIGSQAGNSTATAGPAAQ